MENFVCHGSSTCGWTQSQKTVFYARSHATGSLLHAKCSEEQKQAVILSLTPPCLAQIKHWSLTPTSVCVMSLVCVKMMQHYHALEYSCWSLSPLLCHLSLQTVVGWQPQMWNSLKLLPLPGMLCHTCPSYNLSTSWIIKICFTQSQAPCLSDTHSHTQTLTPSRAFTLRCFQAPLVFFEIIHTVLRIMARLLSIMSRPKQIKVNYGWKNNL